MTRARRLIPFVLLALILVVGPLAASGPVNAAGHSPQERHFRIEAGGYAFTPAEIHVSPGDRVTIELVATDVAHGLTIDGYAVDLWAEPGQPARTTFTAGRAGSFKLRCSVACGALHPLMTGKFEVGVNWRFLQGAGLAMAAVLAGAALGRPGGGWKPLAAWWARRRPRMAWGKESFLLRSRWPLFLARALTLAGFVLAILTGLFGSVVGSQNFAIIFVWIAWWTVLKLVLIPLGGRAWCGVCPVPMPGEWLAQGGILTRASGWGLGRRWPRALGKIRVDGGWLQSAAFLLIGLFSAMTLTQPRLTGWVLLGVLALATGLSLVFEKRAFCNHLCPIGGFCGLYSQVAPVEVRARDRAICAAHAEKTCYQNCPWGVYVAALQDNNPCGMCMECLRVCPHDNVTFNLRAFGKDLAESRRALRLDETALALVMLGGALAFSAVFLGPWGWLRNAAYAIGSPSWVLYSLGFLVFVGLVVPGLWALAVWLGGKSANFKKALAQQAHPLIPLGLGAWVAFTIAFAFAKASYVLPVLSDPFGLGWNLLGTASVVWSPDVTVVSPGMQVAALCGGLLWSAKVAWERCGSARRALTVQAFGLAVTLGLLVLLVG